ncbi:MAG TPA: hypothetical protein VGO93_29435, partial [Candidatus Xenobia bacterium]
NERFHFVDPVAEGTTLALERDSWGHSLADASWAVDEGRVQQAGQVFVWHGQPQFFPMSDRCRNVFRAHDYHRVVRQTLGATHFSFHSAPPPNRFAGERSSRSEATPG